MEVNRKQNVNKCDILCKERKIYMTNEMKLFLKLLDKMKLSEYDFAQLLIVWDAIPYIEKLEWINKSKN